MQPYLRKLKIFNLLLVYPSVCVCVSNEEITGLQLPGKGVC